MLIKIRSKLKIVFRIIILTIEKELQIKGLILKHIYNLCNLFIMNNKIEKKLIYNKYTINNIDKIIWVNPNDIKYHTNNNNNKTSLEDRVFNPYSDRGKILDGNWDELIHKFTELDIYVAIEDRIKNNVDWSETKFYKNFKKNLKKKKIYWNVTNIKELKKRCEYIDNLIYNIQTKGYISNFDRYTSKIDYLKKIDEITVNIGRNGELLFNDGRHRLAIAKILKLKRIPVRILVRHIEWQRFKEKLYLLIKKNNGKLYQPVLHFDLMEIPYSHDSFDRFKSIIQETNIKKGILLDVGANLGFFCHMFEEFHFQCFAVEQSFELYNILKKLKKINNKKYIIINDSIFNIKIIKEKHFDIILALNIFHHFLKTKYLFNKMKKFLLDLKVKEIFFEPHNIEEIQMKNSYKNFTNKEFIKFIQVYTKLTKSKLIHVASDNRKIYKIY